MSLDRCLLIACVTLSQACDSKDAAPTAAPVVTKTAAIVIDDTGYTVDGVRGAPIDAEAVRLQIDGKRRSNDAFDVLLAAPKLARGALVVDGVTVSVRFDKTAPDGPGMQAHLERTGELVLWSTSGTEGTAERPLLVTPFDEPGRNTLRASLADVKARTKATRVDAVIDRVQTMSVVVDLVTTLQSAGYDVRLIAGVPTPSSTLGMSMETPPGLGTLLQEHELPLRRCFEQALRRDAPLTGLDLQVTIEVDKAGEVTHTKVAGSDQLSATMIQCVSTSVLAWKVTAPAGSYQFTIHFKAR